MRHWLLLLAALLLTISAILRVTALPEPHHPDLIRPVFSALDPDGDGRLSRAEFGERAPAGARFSTYDLDSSGDLAPFEIEALLLEVDPVWLTQQED